MEVVELDSDSLTSDPRICPLSVPPGPQGPWSENRASLLPPPSLSPPWVWEGRSVWFLPEPSSFRAPPAPCGHLAHPDPSRGSPGKVRHGPLCAQTALFPSHPRPFPTPRLPLSELPGAPANLGISNIGPRSVTLQFRPGYDGKTSISRWLVEAQVRPAGGAPWRPESRSGPRRVHALGAKSYVFPPARIFTRHRQMAKHPTCPHSQYCLTPTSPPHLCTCAHKCTPVPWGG